MARIQFVCALVALLAIGAHAAPKSVAEAVIANKDDGLGTLLAAVQAADPSILETLSKEDLVATVFAPTDKAFAKLLKKLDLTAEELLADKKTLNAVLKYHVIAGAAVFADDLKRSQVVQTLLEGPTGKLKITSKRAVRLYTTSGGSSKVVDADIAVGDAVIHLVDRVLIPGDKVKFGGKKKAAAKKHH